MSQVATVPPPRRVDLVAWPAGRNGRYLIRSRASGESFELGPEEHFLLERLDGRRSGAAIGQEFAEHFGEPLSADDLHEFVELATERGLLAPSPPVPLPAGERGERPLGPLTPVDTPVAKRTLSARLASCGLKFTSAALRRPATWVNTAAGYIDALRLRRLDYVPRPDDVFIVTYPRSGTTWMQMILYQLTTDGNMVFPHIAEYCPWFEKSVRSARAFETRPSPRLFKSHLPYRKIPRGAGRYIYVARNGRDVAVSCYHLYRMYNGFEGTFDEFFDQFLQGKVEFGSWCEHVREWWAHRHDPNVLFLTYEELSRDLEGTIRRIAAFLNLEPSAADYARIVERSGFAFMKQHEEQFDPVVETLWEQGLKLKSFLRNGRVGEGSVSLTAEQHAQFERQFAWRLQEAGVPVT